MARLGFFPNSYVITDGLSWDLNPRQSVELHRKLKDALTTELPRSGMILFS